MCVNSPKNPHIRKKAAILPLFSVGCRFSSSKKDNRSLRNDCPYLVLVTGLGLACGLGLPRSQTSTGSLLCAVSPSSPTKSKKETNDNRRFPFLVLVTGLGLACGLGLPRSQTSTGSLLCAVSPSSPTKSKKETNDNRRFPFLVLVTGLEPARGYPPEPKSGASANSATQAFFYLLNNCSTYKAKSQELNFNTQEFLKNIYQSGAEKIVKFCVFTKGAL